MKTKLTSFILFFFFSIHSFSQQIGNGLAPVISDFTIPLLSGTYNGLNPIGTIPDIGPPTLGWQHLLVIRHPNQTNNNQVQIASSFNVNDRLFFRKLAGGLEPNNPAWIELATRGSNTFLGNQTVDGNVGIGLTNPQSALEVNGDITLDFKTIYFDRSSNRDHYKISSPAWDDGLRYYHYTAHKFYTQGIERMRIKGDGNIGIGTTSPDSKLTVKGKIHAEEVKIDLAIPADYVFQKYYTGRSELKPDYNLPALSEVEKFAQQNHHLPNVPSAAKIQENGLLLGEMSNILLQKIEELTLYAIEQEKTIAKQATAIEKLEKENESFKKLAARLDLIEKEIRTTK